MAADNEPTDLGANPTRHNPDLDAAFGDMDDAAAKLAEAADRLTDAAGQLGVAGDPIRYNPDLDEAFGVPTPAAKSAAKDVAGGGASQPADQSGPPGPSAPTSGTDPAAAFRTGGRAKEGVSVDRKSVV